MAGCLGCIWHAVYVETPRIHRLPKGRRRAILHPLKLVQGLGTKTATFSDPQEEQAILRYALEHPLGKTIMGRRRETLEIQTERCRKIGDYQP